MYEAKVAAGAAALDRDQPGWESRVDLGRLNMGDMNDCILGQVYEHMAGQAGTGYGIGLRRLDPPRLDGHALGFGIELYLGRLQETWVALLKERYNSGALSVGSC